MVSTCCARAATASSLPVGDADTALTSKNGESALAEPVRAGSEQDPNLVTGIVVRLEAGADREATLASVNEAVTAAFPEASLQVEREYHHALQGVALKAPAGSLDAIRAVPGVAAAFIERETRVRDTVGTDAAGGVRTSRIASQDPDNLSSQVMMRTDDVADVTRILSRPPRVEDEEVEANYAPASGHRKHPHAPKKPAEQKHNDVPVAEHEFHLGDTPPELPDPLELIGRHRDSSKGEK